MEDIGFNDFLFDIGCFLEHDIVQAEVVASGRFILVIDTNGNIVG